MDNIIQKWKQKKNENNKWTKQSNILLLKLWDNYSLPTPQERKMKWEKNEFHFFRNF